MREAGADMSLSNQKKLSKDRLRETLLQRIRSGEYKPGSKIDSIQNIARKEHMSAFTVSQAIRDLTEAGYIVPVTGKGCFIAEKLPGRSNRGNTIGVLATQTLLGHEERCPGQFSHFVECLKAGLKNTRWRIKTHMGQRTIWNQGPLVTDPPELIEWDLSGFVAFDIYDLRYLTRLVEQGLPGVVIDVDASEIGLDSVYPDNLLSGINLVQKLVDQGARRIAFLGGPFHTRDEWERVYYDPASRQRYDGWRVGLMACGLSANDDQVFQIYRRETTHIQKTVRQLLKHLNRFDAVVTEFPDQVVNTLAKCSVPPGTVPVSGWMSAGAELPEGVSAAALVDYVDMADHASRLILNQLRTKKKSEEVQRIPCQLKIVEHSACKSHVS